MPQELRGLFLLRPEVAFLNHGSFGACPRPVFEAYQAWQRELEAEPVDFLGRRFEALMAQARTELAHFLGADPAHLVFVPNATTALNTVAKSLDLQPGDEVLASDHEYGAVNRMWKHICSEKGARYVQAEIPVPVRSEEAIVEALKAQATARTRVLCFSHITSPTALRFPVDELVTWAKERGLVTVIDGAHAPGQIPLHVEALGTDFYAGNCHKWLMAPKGVGFLYARPQAQPLLKPLVISWGPEIRETPGAAPLVEEHEWQGTRDIAAYLAVSEAIRFWTEHGWPEVIARCDALLWEACQALANQGLQPIAADPAVSAPQMASFMFPPCQPKDVQRRIFARYGVEVPLMPWNGRVLLRVSIQGYNSWDDVERLRQALAEVLPELGS